MTLGRIILNVSAAGLSLPKYTPRVSTFLFVHFIFKGLSERVFQGPPHKCARVPQKKDWHTIKRIKIVIVYKPTEIKHSPLRIVVGLGAKLVE